MRVGTEKVGYVNKKLALFVAWALLAAGVVAGSSSPASADVVGVPFPFQAEWEGYATGTGAHVTVLDTGAQPNPPEPPAGPRLINVDAGFSGASTNTEGLTNQIFNEDFVVVQPGDPAPDGQPDPPFPLADKEAYGRGSGLEVTIGEDVPTEDPQIVLPTTKAEAASFPPERSDGGTVESPPETAPTETDTGLVVEPTLEVPVEPVVFANLLEGRARANFNENFCITNTNNALTPLVPVFDPTSDDDISPNKLGYGRGKAALAQVLETGAQEDDPLTPEDESTPEFDQPVVQVGGGDNTGATDTESSTYLVPAPLPPDQQPPEDDPSYPLLSDPNDPETTWALVSEVRGATAPIQLGTLADDPLTPTLDESDYAQLEIHVLSPYMLRVIVDGKNPPILQYRGAELIEIFTGAPPVDPITGEVGPRESSGAIPNPFGEDPRDIGTEDPADLTDPTHADAAVDAVNIDQLLPLAEVTVGHMEVSATVPAEGINCPGSVEILKDFSTDATGQNFEFTVSCVDPNGPGGGDDVPLDLVAGESEDITVIIPGTAPDGTPAPDATATAGPIPSGAQCEVTEDPPPGWDSTQTSADPPLIVTNQFSQVRFLNEPEPAGPGTLVVEKFVPEDNAALQDFTYEFSISCVDRNGVPIETAAGENLPAERQIRPADLRADEDPDPNTAPNPDPQPWYGDTRSTGSFTRPVEGLPHGARCTVTEEDDPTYQADPNHPDFDPLDDPLFRSQPAQTITIVGEAENVVTFRNDPPPPGFGNLIIVKDAPDDDVAQATNFDFSVTCPNGAFNEAFDRDIVGDGESQPVVGIAEGTVCTVHEDVPPGFVVDQNDQQVTILQNTTHFVTFVNRRPDGAGTLVVTKDAPDDAQDVEFDFTADCVTPGPFGGAAVLENIKVTGDGSSGPISFPPGTECRVHEFTEPGFVSQPDVTVTILPDPAVTEAIFINQRVPSGVGSLTVTKDAPNDAQDVIFTFTVHCPSLFNEPFSRSVVGDGTSEPVVGIPAGTLCRVTEPTVNGFLPQPDQQILVADGNNNVTFVNSRGGPVVGGVTFSRQPAAPAVAANAQPRYTG